MDGGYAMVAVWKSDLVVSNQLGGGLTLTGQMPSDDAKSGFADQAGNSLIARFHSLLCRKKFPVPMRREFPCDLLNRLPYLASPSGVTCEPQFFAESKFKANLERPMAIAEAAPPFSSSLPALRRMRRKAT